MSQLRMYWHRQKPPEIKLPEGYTCRRFDGTDADIDAWIAIEKHGLLAADAGREAYIDAMVKHENLTLTDIYFVCEPNGTPVASTTPIIDPKTNMGYVHMVACMENQRGRGLGTQLNNIVLNHIFDAGALGARLDTDDFRLPAIKSYLTAGFLPINNGADVPERWAAILKLLNLPETDIVDEDGGFVQKIHAR